MPRIAFRSVKLGGKRAALVDVANDIIEDYHAQGYRLTLRQLYYQLVARDLVANQQRVYKWVGSVLSDARYAGLVDWEAIEDRVRQPVVWQDFEDLEDCMEDALQSYRLPRWRGQDHRVELWVEKDALAGVLRPIASRYHVTMMVNRGYSSSSAMYDAAERFRRYEDDGHATTLLYLGDHDPSGLDMVRDIQARLEEFGAFPVVRHIALTTAQVRRYEPPPNPAKLTDSRAQAYIAEHGHTSWEVDALPPEVLDRLISGELEVLIDQDALEAVKAQERLDKERLRRAVTAMNDEDGE